MFLNVSQCFPFETGNLDGESLFFLFFGDSVARIIGYYCALAQPSSCWSDGHHRWSTKKTQDFAGCSGRRAPIYRDFCYLDCRKGTGVDCSWFVVGPVFGWIWGIKNETDYTIDIFSQEHHHFLWNPPLLMIMRSDDYDSFAHSAHVFTLFFAKNFGPLLRVVPKIPFVWRCSSPKSNWCPKNSQIPTFSPRKSRHPNDDD